MPDMRDAIAQYLAYTGGQVGGGTQGYMPSPGPNPGPPVPGSFGETYPPPSPIPSTPDIPAPLPGPPGPPVPSNLQGYERLPSGQFLPGSGQQMPPPQMPSGVPPPPPPGLLDDFTPPVDTPMQAPAPGGQQIGGMDPQAWLRMYQRGW